VTTNAKLKSKLPNDGHGLSFRLCDEIYAARAKGQPTDDLLIVGRISPIGHGEENGKRFVSFEISQLEIATEHPDTTHVIDIISAASDRRHGGRQLPLGFDSQSDDQQRRDLLRLIEEDWALEEGLTVPGGVAERWRAQWAIGDGEDETSDGAFVNGDYRKAAVHHIKEFAYMVGVISDAPGGDELASDDVAGTDEDDDAVDEPVPAALS
jgi:hypothetical protein